MTIAARLLAEHFGDPDGFVRALLGAMTLREKLGQLSLYSVEQDMDADPFNPVFHPVTATERLEAVRQGLVGGFFNAVGIERLAQLQEIAVAQGRLGIPLIFAADVIHGFRTIFPVPLAEMASWDPDLARHTATAAAREASSAGIDWTFAPGVDVARDARWGRIVESSGEDVLLACRFAGARVAGYQQGDLASPNAVMATAKHFAGYGAAEAGLDYSAADISWRTLEEHYLPPFKAAIDAGVGSVMTGFHDVEGVPCTANEALLTGVLRDRWGFKGLVVSDYTSDFELIGHGLADGPRQAALLSLKAGLDVSLESGLFVDHGEELVKSGDVSEAVVDAAVDRVLRAKLALGLFDDPFRRLRSGRSEVVEPAHRPLARQAAARAPVLLKNDSALPLREGCKVALIGPLADDQSNLNGCWSMFGSGEHGVTLKQAMLAQIGSERLVHAAGCELTEGAADQLAAACAAAREADVVVLAIGESERWSGEARSRVRLDLPAAQLDLAQAVHACGKPIVAIVATGRPLALGALEPYCDALMISWFLGSESGWALCDLLTGAAAPRARLPVSFPRHASHTPLYYNRKASGRPFRRDGELFRNAYLDERPTPLFPFGFGLTYTTFHIGEPSAESADFTPGQPLKISAVITNTGTRRGDTLVQLYVRDVAASVVRPIRELKDFKWVSLAPGERQTVQFVLHADQLKFRNPAGTYDCEPGQFEVWISDHAESGHSILVTLAEQESAACLPVETQAVGSPY